MVLNFKEKQQIKKQLTKQLKKVSSIRKIILFGSFLNTLSPQDIDIAIVDDSKKDYLTLSLDYRKKLRSITKIIPIDIFPVQSTYTKSSFGKELAKGEILYEKRN